MAFEPRIGRRSTGSRAALVGAVAALAGVAGAITLTRGVADAAGHPERAGVVADAEFSVVVDNPDDVRPNDRLVDTVTAHPGVTAAVPVLRYPSDIDGLAVPTFGFGDRIVGDEIEPTVIEGRLPSSDDEVALGPSTADLLGVAIGDEVALQDDRTATVVGTALFPTDVHSRFDEGAITTWNRSVDLLDASAVGAGDTTLTIAVRLDTGRDQAGVDALAAALDGQVEAVEATGVPPEIDNLQRIRRLPLGVAAFLLVLGVAAVGYGLASSVRRRRRDIAVWRALGMTTGNARTAVLAEATTIALVGTVAGVPVGIVLGRLSWKAISDRIPLAFVAPLAVGALALVVAIAFVLANVLAILPGRHAARLRPAAVLRAE
jgi:ABC-type antimicrobial peptide transport system permease subunit